MLYNHENPGHEEEDDFFDGPDIPETPPEPKKPACKPEDPDYWEGEESEWEHLRPAPGKRPWLWMFLSLAIIIVAAAAWLRWFSPCIDDATAYGYVELAEKRGTLFKTYEGVALPYREITDTTRHYREDFVFSVAGRDQYKALRRAMLDCRPVRVDYKVYHAPLPWRGESRVVVTGVDSVDPSRILPPEFR